MRRDARGPALRFPRRSSRKGLLGFSLRLTLCQGASRLQGIFIIGEQRSGSNLLRIMLAGGGLAVPHPAHVLSLLLL